LSKLTVHIHRLVQDSQDYGGDDEHMVSRVFFSIEYGGATYPDCYVDVKQPVGSSFEEVPLEISRQQGYRGPFDYDGFSEAVERYYRQCVGSNAGVIRIRGGTVRMRDNVFELPATIELSVEQAGGPW
jgi:hypothetical protein